jgi:transposase
LSPSRKGPYATAVVSPAVKQQVAEVAARKHNEGLSWKEVAKDLGSGSYEPAAETLRRQARQLKRGAPLFKDEKDSGPFPSLDAWQMWVLGGRVWETEGEMSLLDVVHAIIGLFHVAVSKPTACRYMQELGLTWKLTAKRAIPRGMTREKYIAGFWDFVVGVRTDGFFTAHKENIGFMDFFTDTRRSERPRAYQGKGLPPKKAHRDTVRYTSTYAIAVWLQEAQGGLGWTPALCYTRNKAFMPPVAPRIVTLAKLHKVDLSRIRYIPPPKGKEEKAQAYVGENYHMVRDFCDTYKVELALAHVIHDDGNAFKLPKTMGGALS